MCAPAVLGLALCAGDEEISCRPSSRVHLTIVRTAGEQDVQGTGSLDRLFVLSRGDQSSQATTQTRPASVLGGCDGFLLVRPGSCGVRGPGDHLIRVALYSHGFTVRGFPTPSAVGGHSSCSHSITSRVVSTSGPTVDVSRETSTLRSRFIVAPPGARSALPTPAGTGTGSPMCVGPSAATGTAGQTSTPSSEGRRPGQEPDTCTSTSTGSGPGGSTDSGTCWETDTGAVTETVRLLPRRSGGHRPEHPTHHPATTRESPHPLRSDRRPRVRLLRYRPSSQVHPGTP